MKKITLLLLLLIGFANVLQADNDRIDIDYIEYKPTQRSLIDPIEATLDYDMQSIEFIFNDQIGNVTITVSTMGQVVASAVCNTSYESIRWISVPMTPGDYYIYISGASYEGEGSYTISEGFDL